jgi:hypothetical protein
MKTYNKQQTGMSFISLLVLLMMVGFLALLALRIGPLYLEHYTITSLIQKLKQEPTIGQRTAQEVRTTIEKQLYVNDVHRFEKDEYRDSIKVSRETGVLKVAIAYEAREHIMANVDVIVSFSDEAEFPTTN